MVVGPGLHRFGDRLSNPYVPRNGHSEGGTQGFIVPAPNVARYPVGLGTVHVEREFV